MRSTEPTSSEDSRPPKYQHRMELFYFDQVGSRYVLRFTRMAVLLIIGLTVVSIVSILVIFLVSSQQMASEPVNVNVSVPTLPTSPTDKPILKPPPPAPRLPKVAQPVYSTPAPSNTPALNKNSNGQTIPKQTPQSPLPTTSESPP
jgi:hypothetical protein